MTTDVISAAEAWEAVERLKLTVAYGYVTERWYATIHKPEVCVDVGFSALEAVANLLARIGEAATAKAESAKG